MPLIMSDLDKPGPAMMIPTFQCGHCSRPIERPIDGGVYWYTSDNGDETISSPVEYAHRGHCFVQVADLNGPGVLMDMQLDQFLAVFFINR
jgi:hypothetical protein